MMRQFAVLSLCLAAISAPMVGAQEGAPREEAPLPPLEEQVVEENASLTALRQVQTYMEEVKSLEAHFMQRAPSGKVAHGKLFMERPGLVRFDYTDETPFLIVADGKTLNFIDYEIGQVTKWPLNKTPLRALLGGSIDLASLQARIEVEPAGIANLVALVARDPENPEQGEITLYFHRDPTMESGLKLASWAVADAKGEITYVELSEQTVNTELADNLWTFEDPRGLAKRRRTRR